jgi:C4-dicarboxylate transporter/malic acid transport protein
MAGHPAWFGSVMGTAATSAALLLQSQIWAAEWIAYVAVAFLLGATLLALVLWPRYARRLADRRALAAELGDPGHGAMLATFPAGLLVLAVAWGRVGPEIVPADLALGVSVALLVLGVITALAVGIGWAGSITSGTNDLAAVNGGWLIPPVMNLLVPLAMLPLIARYPDQAPWLLVVAFAFLGAGAVLFLVMMTLLVARLALRPPQAAPLAPSLWIPLAPAGVGGFAFLRLMQAGQAAGVEGFTSDTAGVIVASMGIGLGLWWAMFAAVDLARLRRLSPVPVHPGWWGFVFPVAAMTLSISGVGQALDVRGIEVVGALATVALLGVWALVAARTAGLVRPSVTR